MEQNSTCPLPNKSGAQILREILSSSRALMRTFYPLHPMDPVQVDTPPNPRGLDSTHDEKDIKQ
jgi:hypothetical protein